MKDNFTSEDLVQYLDGDLGKEDLQGMQAKLQADAGFRDEFLRLQLARETIKLHGLKERVGNIHREMMQELQAEPVKETTPVIPMFRRVMRIAAILILVVAGAAIYEYTQLSANSLFEKNYSAYTATEQRGADNASALVAAYKAGETGKVVELFQALPQPAAQDLFYVGNAYLQLGKPMEAIRNFQQLEALNKTNQTHVFEEDTEYYLAMAYLKNGQTKEAIALLEKIHNTNGHPYQDKVSNWLLWKLKLAGG